MPISAATMRELRIAAMGKIDAGRWELAPRRDNSFDQGPPGASNKLAALKGEIPALHARAAALALEPPATGRFLAASRSGTPVARCWHCQAVRLIPASLGREFGN